MEWHPPGDATRLLLAGDETAVPAICAIAESLPEHARASVLLEVPTAGDVLDVAVPEGVRITWLPRRSGGRTTPRGSPLTAAVLAAVGGTADCSAPASGADMDDVDGETDLLWEVPPEPSGTSGLYAWLAGEAGVVRALRRHLVGEVGVPRTSVAFMGYWRQGRGSD